MFNKTKGKKEKMSDFKLNGEWGLVDSDIGLETPQRKTSSKFQKTVGDEIKQHPLSVSYTADVQHSSLEKEEQGPRTGQKVFESNISNAYDSKKHSVLKIQKGDMFSESSVHMSFKMSSICQILGLAFTVAIFTGLIIFASFEHHIWYTWNGDTLATQFSNIMVSPSQERKTAFTNSEESERNYVRYEDYIEFITSSVDFLFHKDAGVYTNPYKAEARKNETRSKRNMYLSEIGESNYVASYHQHLSEEPNVPSDHINLASINTITKMRTSLEGNNDTVYGKLSLATYDGSSRKMFEAATFDSSNIHLRSQNVFTSHNLFVGHQMYFALQSDASYDKNNQFNVYLPLISISSNKMNVTEDIQRRQLYADTVGKSSDYNTFDFDTKHYTNTIHSDKEKFSKKEKITEHTMNIGNADIDHLNMLSSTSVVIGTYSRKTDRKSYSNSDKYTVSMVHSENNTYCMQPLVTQESVKKIYTDANRVDILGEDDWHVRERKSALDKIVALPVHQVRSKDSQRHHVSFLAQNIEKILPEAVVTAQYVALPQVKKRQHGKLPSPKSFTRQEQDDSITRPSDFSLQLKSQTLKTVDTDAIIAYLVMAVQEQQKMIEELRAQKT